jgi:ABC-type multidrug transport system ATPase subunit
MQPTIEAHGLEKHYGKTKALDGLDLIAERGQVVAVLGPNGAGKTTFVRTVATLLRADSGTLRVAGRDARTEPAAVRRVIGLAGQFAAVEPAMTGRENIEMVARLFGQTRREAKANAAAVLEKLGLTDAGGGSRARTRAACAGGSTSAPAWSGHRACCCSTSPRPGLTRAAGSSSGARSAAWSRRAPTCC